MDRRDFLKAAGVSGVIGLAGCAGGPQSDTTEQTTQSGGDGGDGGSDTTTQTTTTESSDGGDGGDGDGGDGGDGGSEPTNIGMVYATGGLGDGSFNDQAQQGLFAADEDFNLEFQETQPQQVSEFATFQQQFAQSTNPDYDLINCIGFLQTDALTQTSADFPEQDFMLVDSVVDAPNVANYVFAEHEGSYLVGQLAGLLTSMDFEAGGGATAGDSTNVGFVGGVEGDLIGRFEAGFTAGVKAANSDVDVITNYTGSFNDPQAGFEAASSMYSSGADIVYHASGNTGTGVFEAAQEEGGFAIGVDRDQSVTKPSFSDVILASMIKRVDTAVYNSIEAKVNGEFESGVIALGLEQEGVGVVYGQDLGDAIPDDVKGTVDQSRQMIIDGEISVPTDPNNV